MGIIFEDQDCLGKSCPMYGWSQFNKNPVPVVENKKNISPRQMDGLNRWRESQKKENA